MQEVRGDGQRQQHHRRLRGLGEGSFDEAAVGLRVLAARCPRPILAEARGCREEGGGEEGGREEGGGEEVDEDERDVPPPRRPQRPESHK